MKILVACDGSSHSLRAAGFAIGLIRKASSEKGSLLLLNVHDDTALRHAKAVVGSSAVASYLKEVSEEDLAETRKAVEQSGIPFEVESRVGRISEEVVAAARAHGCDMIVMGAKGRGAVVDMLIGSVAQRVLATSPIPVLFVK